MGALYGPYLMGSEQCRHRQQDGGAGGLSSIVKMRNTTTAQRVESLRLRQIYVNVGCVPTFTYPHSGDAFNPSEDNSALFCMTNSVEISGDLYGQAQAPVSMRLMGPAIARLWIGQYYQQPRILAASYDAAMKLCGTTGNESDRFARWFIRSRRAFSRGVAMRRSRRYGQFRPGSVARGEFAVARILDDVDGNMSRLGEPLWTAGRCVGVGG